MSDVYWDGERMKWGARAGTNHLGFFASEREAKEVLEKAKGQNPHGPAAEPRKSYWLDRERMEWGARAGTNHLGFFASEREAKEALDEAKGPNSPGPAAPRDSSLEGPGVGRLRARSVGTHLANISDGELGHQVRLLVRQLQSLLSNVQSSVEASREAVSSTNRMINSKGPWAMSEARANKVHAQTVAEEARSWALRATEAERKGAKSKRVHGCVWEGDGERYYGSLNKERMSMGPGQHQYKCGAVYTGNFRNDKRSGLGKLTDKYGHKFLGQFEADYFHGMGTLEFTKGKYEGSFIGGRMQGYGVYTSSIHTYWGLFKAGKWSEIGVLECTNGTRYDGQFENDVRSGYGRIESGPSFPGGVMKYEGQWVVNVQEGLGQFTDPKMHLYTGRWKKGSYHGCGEYQYPNKDRYEGGFHDGCKHGFGRYTYHADGTFRGQFKQDHICGLGFREFGNGDVFIGSYENSERHGYGVELVRGRGGKSWVEHALWLHGVKTKILGNPVVKKHMSGVKVYDAKLKKLLAELFASDSSVGAGDQGGERKERMPRRHKGRDPVKPSAISRHPSFFANDGSVGAGDQGGERKERMPGRHEGRNPVKPSAISRHPSSFATDGSVGVGIQGGERKERLPGRHEGRNPVKPSAISHHPSFFANDISVGAGNQGGQRKERMPGRHEGRSPVKPSAISHHPSISLTSPFAFDPEEFASQPPTNPFSIPEGVKASNLTPSSPHARGVTPRGGGVSQYDFDDSKSVATLINPVRERFPSERTASRGPASGKRRSDALVTFSGRRTMDVAGGDKVARLEKELAQHRTLVATGSATFLERQKAWNFERRTMQREIDSCLDRLHEEKARNAGMSETLKRVYETNLANTTAVSQERDKQASGWVLERQKLFHRIDKLKRGLAQEQRTRSRVQRIIRRRTKGQRKTTQMVHHAADMVENERSLRVAVEMERDKLRVRVRELGEAESFLNNRVVQVESRYRNLQRDAFKANSENAKLTRDVAVLTRRIKGAREGHDQESATARRDNHVEEGAPAGFLGQLKMLKRQLVGAQAAHENQLQKFRTEAKARQAERREALHKFRSRAQRARADLMEKQTEIIDLFRNLQDDGKSKGGKENQGGSPGEWTQAELMRIKLSHEEAFMKIQIRLGELGDALEGLAEARAEKIGPEAHYPEAPTKNGGEKKKSHADLEDLASQHQRVLAGIVSECERAGKKVELLGVEYQKEILEVATKKQHTSGQLEESQRLLLQATPNSAVEDMTKKHEEAMRKVRKSLSDAEAKASARKQKLVSLNAELEKMKRRLAKEWATADAKHKDELKEMRIAHKREKSRILLKAEETRASSAKDAMEAKAQWEKERSQLMLEMGSLKSRADMVKRLQQQLWEAKSAVKNEPTIEVLKFELGNLRVKAGVSEGLQNEMAAIKDDLIKATHANSLLRVELKHKGLEIARMKKLEEEATHANQKADQDGAAQRLAVSTLEQQVESLKQQLRNVLAEFEGSKAAMELERENYNDDVEAHVVSLREAEMLLAKGDELIKQKIEACDEVEIKRKSEQREFQEKIAQLEEEHEKHVQKLRTHAAQDLKRCMDEQAEVFKEEQRRTLESAAKERSGLDQTVLERIEAALKEVRSRLPAETKELKNSPGPAAVPRRDRERMEWGTRAGTNHFGFFASERDAKEALEKAKEPSSESSKRSRTEANKEPNMLETMANESADAILFSIKGVVDSLRAENERRGAETAKLRAELGDARRKMSGMATEHKAAKMSAAASCSTARSAEARAKRAHEQRVSGMNLWTENEKDLRHQIRSLRQQIQEAQSSYVKARLSTLGNSARKSSELFSRLSLRPSLLGATDQTDRPSKAHDVVAKMASEGAVLSQQLVSLKASKEKAEFQKTSAEKMLASANEHLQTREAEISGLRGELQKAIVELEVTKNNYKNLMAHAATLKKQIQASSADTRSEMSRAAKALEDLAGAQQQVAQLKASLEGLQGENQVSFKARNARDTDSRVILKEFQSVLEHMESELDSASESRNSLLGASGVEKKSGPRMAERKAQRAADGGILGLQLHSLCVEVAKKVAVHVLNSGRDCKQICDLKAAMDGLATKQESEGTDAARVKIEMLRDFDSLKRKLDDLTHNNARLKKEADTSQTLVSELSTQKAKAERGEAKLRQEFDGLKRKFDGMSQEQARSKDAKVAEQLSEQLAEAERTGKDLRRNLSEMTQRYDDLALKHARLRKESEKTDKVAETVLKRRVSVERMAYDQLKQEMEAVKKKHARLQKEASGRKDLWHRASTQKIEVERLRAEEHRALKELEVEYQKTREKRDADFARNAAKVQELERTIGTLRQMIAGLKKAVRKKAGAVEELEHEKAEVERHAERAERMVAKLQDRLKMTGEEKREQMERIAAQRRAEVKSRLTIASLKQELEGLSEVHTQLKLQKEDPDGSLRRELKELKEQHQQMHSEVQKKESLWWKADAEKKAIEERAAKAESSLEGMKSKVNALEQEKARAKTEAEQKIKELVQKSESNAQESMEELKEEYLMKRKLEYKRIKGEAQRKLEHLKDEAKRKLRQLAAKHKNLMGEASKRVQELTRKQEQMQSEAEKTKGAWYKAAALQKAKAERAAALEKSLADAKNQLGELTQKHEQLQKEAQEKQSLWWKADAERKATMERATTMQLEFEGLKGQFDDLSKRHTSLESESGKKEKLWYQASASEKAAMERAEKVEKTLEALSKEFQELAQKHERAKVADGEKEDLIRRLADEKERDKYMFESKLKDTDGRLKSVADERKSLKSEIEKLRLQRESRKGETERLLRMKEEAHREACLEMEKNIASLKAELIQSKTMATRKARMALDQMSSKTAAMEKTMEKERRRADDCAEKVAAQAKEIEEFTSQKTQIERLLRMEEEAHREACLEMEKNIASLKAELIQSKTMATRKARMALDQMSSKTAAMEETMEKERRRADDCAEKVAAQAKEIEELTSQKSQAKRSLETERKACEAFFDLKQEFDQLTQDYLCAKKAADEHSEANSRLKSRIKDLLAKEIIRGHAQARLQREKEDYEQTVEDLERKLGNLDDLNRQFDALTTKYGDLKKDNDARKVREKEMQRTLENMTQEHANEIAEMKSQKRFWEPTVIALTKDLSLCKIMLETARAEASDERAKRSEELAGCQRQLKERKAKLAIADTKVQALEAHAEELNRELQEADRGLKDAVQLAQSAQANEVDTKSRLGVEISDLKARSDSLEGQLGELRKTIKLKNEEIEQLAEKEKDHQGVAALRMELEAELKEKIRELEEEKLELVEEQKECMERVAKLEIELEGGVEGLTSKEDVKKANAALGALLGQSEKLKLRVAKLENQRSILKSANENFRRRNSELGKSNAALVATRKDLQEQLKHRNLRCSLAEAQCDQLRQNLGMSVDKAAGRVRVLLNPSNQNSKRIMPTSTSNAKVAIQNSKSVIVRSSTRKPSSRSKIVAISNAPPTLAEVKLLEERLRESKGVWNGNKNAILKLVGHFTAHKELPPTLRPEVKRLIPKLVQLAQSLKKHKAQLSTWSRMVSAGEECRLVRARLTMARESRHKLALKVKEGMEILDQTLGVMRQNLRRSSPNESPNASHVNDI